MNRLFRIVLVSFLWLQASVTYAANMSQAQAQDFLQTSGLSLALDQLPAVMAQQIEVQRLSQLNPGDQNKVSEALRASVNELDSGSVAVGYLTESVDESLLSGTIRFLKTDFGRKVVAEEAASNSAEGQAEMASFIATLGSNPPSDKRIALIQDLMISTGVVEKMMHILSKSMLGMADLVGSIKPEQADVLRSQLNAQWQQIQPMLEVQLKQQMIYGSHYAYRNLSDSEIEQYLAFLKSEDGKRYVDETVNIMEAVFTRFFANIVSAIQAQS